MLDLFVFSIVTSVLVCISVVLVEDYKNQHGNSTNISEPAGKVTPDFANPTNRHGNFIGCFIASLICLILGYLTDNLHSYLILLFCPEDLSALDPLLDIALFVVELAAVGLVSAATYCFFRGILSGIACLGDKQ